MVPAADAATTPFRRRRQRVLQRGGNLSNDNSRAARPPSPRARTDPTAVCSSHRYKRLRSALFVLNFARSYIRRRAKVDVYCAAVEEGAKAYIRCRDDRARQLYKNISMLFLFPVKDGKLSTGINATFDALCYG